MFLNIEPVLSDLFECKLIIVEPVIIADLFPPSFPLSSLHASDSVSRRYDSSLLRLLFKLANLKIALTVE